MTAATDDGTALLAAIREHPEEDTPRLMYADWLEEHGERERAEFIRVQCELAARGKWFNQKCHREEGRHYIVNEGGKIEAVACQDCWASLRDRERELWDENARLWRWRLKEGCYPENRLWAMFANRAPADAAEPHLVYSRGFVESVTCTAADWLKHGDAIREQHPVTRVTLTTMPEHKLTDNLLNLTLGGKQYAHLIPQWLTPGNIVAQSILVSFKDRWPGVEFTLPS